MGGKGKRIKKYKLVVLVYHGGIKYSIEDMVVSILP